VDDGLQPTAELPPRRVMVVMPQLLEQLQQDVLRQIFGILRPQSAMLAPSKDRIAGASVEHRPSLIVAAALSQFAQKRDGSRWDRHGDISLLRMSFGMVREYSRRSPL